jgi:hypothetical protein
MFDFRHAHRNVVLGRSALNPSAPASLATQQAKTPTLQRRKKDSSEKLVGRFGFGQPAK